MRHHHMGIAAALVAALAAPAAAQEDAVPDPAAMDKLAAAVPAQPWYPEGYYDVRIAAEAQVADGPRKSPPSIAPCPDGAGLCFDAIDPRPLRINPDESDPAVRRFGDAALAVSRLRQELAAAGYPADVFTGPLNAYERKWIEAAPLGADLQATRDLAAAIEANRQRNAAGAPRILAYDEKHAIVIRAIGPSAAIFTAGKRLARDERLMLRAGDQVTLLQAGKTRTLSGPGTFLAGYDDPAARIAALPPMASRGYGATRGLSTPATRGVVFQTNPPSGEVLLVSAFAFRICQRKGADPWDRLKCRWNEVETGVANPLSGRFVYQVKWPDGTVRKGTREIAPAQSGAVTFKKVGS